MNEIKNNPEAIEVVHEQIIPQQESIVNDYDIDAFLEKRKEFITKVNKIMIEGKDYHVIQNKKSLAKGGAEKIASIFGWTATFEKDTDITSAFGDIKGLIAFVCNLEKNGQRLGQGRGAASLAKNNQDPNKTIKMAQKSAFIDAVLRASGLSDFFTQDLGPEDEGAKYNHLNQNMGTPGTSTNVSDGIHKTEEKLASSKQIDLIKQLLKDKGIQKLSDIGFKMPAEGGITMSYAKQIIDALFKLPKQV